MDVGHILGGWMQNCYSESVRKICRDPVRILARTNCRLLQTPRCNRASNESVKSFGPGPRIALSVLSAMVMSPERQPQIFRPLRCTQGPQDDSVVSWRRWSPRSQNRDLGHPAQLSSKVNLKLARLGSKGQNRFGSHVHRHVGGVHPQLALSHPSIAQVPCHGGERNYSRPLIQQPAFVAVLFHRFVAKLILLESKAPHGFRICRS